MTRRPLIGALLVLGAAAAPADARTLNVYSSLPLQGASRPQTEDVVRGIKLAFEEHGFAAGGHQLRYVSLDDSTAAAGKWDPDQTEQNARHVARDEDAIAYIGEFNSGATANSLPTLNEAGILQVSPSNTLRGLTRSGPGASPGEPDRYYPTGQRTYGRIVAQDDAQAAAQVELMRAAGVQTLFVLRDREPYGRGVAALVRAKAPAAGIRVVGRGTWRGRAARYRKLARRVRASGAQAVFAGGTVDNNAPQLLEDVHAGAPGAELFAPDGMATRSLTRELPARVQRRLHLTTPTVPPSALPPAGQDFYRRFEERYGVAESQIDPYAIYGYEAGSVVLDAIDRGGDDRAAVIEAFFATRDRDSVLGRYSIDQYGDTTLGLYGAYRARRGRLVFERAVGV